MSNLGQKLPPGRVMLSFAPDEVLKNDFRMPVVTKPGLWGNEDDLSHPSCGYGRSLFPSYIANSIRL